MVHEGVRDLVFNLTHFRNRPEGSESSLNSHASQTGMSTFTTQLILKVIVNVLPSVQDFLQSSFPGTLPW